MKLVPLVWAMLWRSRVRTGLTFLSIVIAFTLFGLLEAVETAFETGARIAGADRLVVQSKAGLTVSLPLAQRGRIESIRGVKAVFPELWFAGWYQDPKNSVTALALDIKAGYPTDPRVRIPAEQLAAMIRTPAGIIVGRDVAQKFGWKLGDRIPLGSDIWPRKSGSHAWEFDLVGFYDLDRDIVGRGPTADWIFINYDYLNKENQYGEGIVSWYVAQAADVRQVNEVGRAIDAAFRNSDHETKTQTERDFQLGLIKRIGDVGAMTAAVLWAVFFTLLLVAGNTMMQAFRERPAQIAVLKTIGFTDGVVAGLFVAESLLLLVSAATLGLAAAAALVPLVAHRLSAYLPDMAILDSTLIDGMWLAVGMGLLVALIPAWHARRLGVVEALAEL